MSVTYMILIQEVTKEDLSLLHTGKTKLQRKKLELGEIGIESGSEAASPGVVTLSLLDGSPQGAEVTVRRHHVKKLSEDSVGLLRSINDLSLRWQTYSSPGVLAAARAITVGCAVTYRKHKTGGRKLEHLGVVQSLGRIDGRDGTRFSVELLVSDNCSLGREQTNNIPQEL